MKRKRKIRSRSSQQPDPKKRKTEASTQVSSRVCHPVLSTLYPEVLTLRAYLTSQLSQTSRRRQRTVGQYGKNVNVQNADDDLNKICELLDNILVGVSPKEPDEEHYTIQDVRALSQQVTAATGGSYVVNWSSQTEV